MAMNLNDGVTQVIATGGELSVSWDFKIADRGELRIIRTRSGVNETLVLDSTYTIASNQLNQDGGGIAVLTGSATPAQAGDIYTLLLDTPYARGTAFGTSDFNQAGALFASVINNQFDNIVRMCQRLGRGVAKSLRLPDTDTETIEGSLPSASIRAGKALFFDALGNPSVTSNVDTVSAAAAAASALAAANSAAIATAAAAGFTVKAPCRMATTGNITLSGLQTIDTIVGVAGDRVLVWQQTTPSQNGIYIMAVGAWARATDSDTWDELVSQLVTVQEGAIYADVNFLCTINPGGTLGATAVTYNPWQTIIPDNAVTNAKLADMAANSVKARAAATSGDPSDVALSASQLIGRGATGDVAAISLGTGLSMSGTTLQPNIFESAEQAFTSSATVTFAHGLGATPRFIDVFARCKIAEQNYLVGDEVRFFQQNTTTGSNRITMVVANATDITITNLDGPLFLNKTTPATTFNPTVANWRWVVRAWR